MKLFKMELSKKELDSIPKTERRFFVLIANVLNDIIMLHKFAIFSNRHRENPIEMKAQNSLTFFILILLAGKLWEGWKMLGRELFGSKLSAEYDQILSPEGKESLQNLKYYFGKGDNLINYIRNKIGFHYKYGDEILEILEEMSNDEKLEIYFSDAQGNCFYYLSSILTSSLILRRIDKSDPLKALDSFFEQIVSQVSVWFLSLLSACLIVIADKYLGRKYEAVEINDPRSVDDIVIPYFVKK